MNAVLRLIDANANRAREGLRVLEDYARFVLDSDELTAELKGLRHGLTQALHPVLADAILHRDTEGDVGTGIKAEGELSREDVEQVVTAAGKRLGEALRALEEYLKVEHPGSARAIEQARYRFYVTEQKLALTLRRSDERLETATLYVLITESACKGNWFETAKAAVHGGADVIQLREKEMEAGEMLRRARELAKLCQDAGVLLIVNDRPDVALLSGADGVHVGQGDLPAVEVRKVVGRRMIVGVSTHEIAHARQAKLDGADYIGAGPTFLSPTKPRTINPGLAYLRELAEFSLPTFAIAGITHANLPQVLETGVRRVAVTAAVTGSDDPENAARQLKALLCRDS